MHFFGFLDISSQEIQYLIVKYFGTQIYRLII